jgi:DNA modification methylase
MMERDLVLNQDCLPYLAALPDNSVDVVITDPPYPNGAGLFKESLIDGIAALYLAAKKTKKHMVFFWTPLVDPPRAPSGWYEVSKSVWAKPDARSAHAYELIVVWSRDYRRKAHRVWNVPILDFRSLKDWHNHPTQKPLRLLRYLVDTYTSEGDTILDCFAGPGTTGVAARERNRHYILVEIDKHYADIGRERVTQRPPNTTTNDPTTTPSETTPDAIPNDAEEISATENEDPTPPKET